MKSSNNKVCHAIWNSLRSGFILLGEDWLNEAVPPPLFLGPIKRPFKILKRAQVEEFGRMGRYYRKGNYWHFMLRPERYLDIDFREDPPYLAADFNGWAEGLGNPDWRLRAKKDPLTDKIIYKLIVPARNIAIEGPQRFKFVTANGRWLDVPSTAPNWVKLANGIGNLELDPRRTGLHVFYFETPDNYEPVGNEEVLWVDNDVTESVPFPPTDRLLEACTKAPLGAIIENNSTTFRLFAPRASAVAVAFGRNSNGVDFQRHAMSRVEGEETLWELTLNGDFHGAYYWYYIDGNNSTGTTYFDVNFPILDPYALAALGPRGPGIIWDRNRIPKPEKRFCPPDWHDLIIAEAHVRDLITHAPVNLCDNERYGFGGLLTCVAREACYLRELGINAIEFQPLQEFDAVNPHDYHWGYMPVNYFAPASAYATQREKASQIAELQAVVRTLHEAGIAVIVDVVYNHVGEPNHLLFIDKFYYFNLSKEFDLMNWSGCGNDLRCDTPMALRLIVDSLKHWVEVFDVDGFRFDLAELIGVAALEVVEHELKKIKPGIILIAEPWSFRGHIQDALKNTGFASWSDSFRKFLPDYVHGYGNQEGIQYFLSGSPAATRFAAQVINYTESHDDLCWIDTITENPDHNGTYPTRNDRVRTHLMAAILFASLGIPMISAGQDFLRSKQGVSNTYLRGDLNALDYNRRFMHVDTHNYFAAWIRFRRSNAGRFLRYDGKPGTGYQQFYFASGMSAVAVVYNADGSLGNERLLFAVNPHSSYAGIWLPDIHIENAVQIADRERFDLNGLGSARMPIEDNAIHLPSMSCGVWLLRAD
jgi:pullulanase